MNFTRAIIPCSTIKKWYDLYLGTHWAVATMGDKSVETLGSKIRFLSVLVTFCPLPPKTMRDWGDRHGVQTLRLTVQRNLDFSAKCFSSIRTWLEKDCAIEKYFF